MSSGRIEKRKSQPSRNRDALLNEILRDGFEVMPCSYCFDHNLVCKMIERTKRCQTCVGLGRSCDGTGVPVGVLSRVTAEAKRLEREEIDEEEKFLELQKQINEVSARLIRLRKQRRSLREKGIQMVQRGLQNLDELEEMERKESEAAAQESSAVLEVQANGGFDVIDWSTVGLGGGQLLTGLDFAGGTAEASAGNASGSR
ncbi:uncharacterized protein E0L32_010353 [Thyridium curvatum]|uniref:Uncharacterized protein n=1 Tax=Thyridium curvatum TaxID=1093900 RepID=A0A507ASP9_9PEZI|nr:uncharacterized protein E0L32_010353 [Thyridium curvatum]TPX07898.1 hypothetical protein E0L32_010353 [Thyridium curvatum]